MGFKTEDTDMIICPNCGEQVDDSPFLFQVGEDEIEISCLNVNCNQRMRVEVRSIPKYTSYKIEDKD